MVRRTMLAGLLLVATGCGTATVGREFDPDMVTPGSSTKADVLAPTGEPYIREVLPNGTEMWSYLWWPGRRAPRGPYYLTSHVPMLVMMLQFRDGVLVGPSVDPAIFRTFTPGTTTVGEVHAAAGAPFTRRLLPDDELEWTYVFWSAGTTTSVTVLFKDWVLVRSGMPPK